MDPRLFNPASPTPSARPELGGEAPLGESIRLPPLQLDRYVPSPSRRSPPLLPHIQSLRPTPFTNEFVFTVRSPLLSNLLISTTQQQTSHNFMSWAQTYFKTFSTCRFFCHKLDSSLLTELQYDLLRFGGSIEETYSDLVTHIIFLPHSTNSKPITLPPLPIVKDERSINNSYLSHLTTRFLSPYQQGRMASYISNSGHHIDRQTPPVKIETQEPHLSNSFRTVGNDYNRMEDRNISQWYFNNYQRDQEPSKVHVLPGRLDQSTISYTKLPSLSLTNLPKPRHKVSEIHFFRYPYILAEDMTGVHRPAVAAEYPPSKDPDEILWPKLWVVPPTRCPFIRVMSRNKMGGASKRQADSNPGPRAKASKLSNRSGYSVQSQRESALELQTKAQRLAAVPNHFLHLETRNQTPKTLPPPPRLLRTKTSAPGPLPNTKKPGYCENCRIKFTDIEEHVMSRVHRDFALKESNFISLDVLLRRLHRTVKPLPIVVPTPSATNPSSSSPHHWYGKSARDYESEIPSTSATTYFDFAGEGNVSQLPYLQ